MRSLSRRDFLKMAGALSCASLVQRAAPLASWALEGDSRQPNIIVVIFDALSALHLPLHGYPRPTCPNFERLAQRATIFHNHRSAANFTTPSTASLFTGVYPWEHRAVTLTGMIQPTLVANNIFRLLGSKYFRAAFAQNIYADMLLYQLDRDLDRHQAMDSYALTGATLYNNLPGEEAIYALKSYDQFLFKPEEVHGSLFLSLLNDANFLLQRRLVRRSLASTHPDGLPSQSNTQVLFLLQQVMDGVMRLLDELPSPYFAYLHFMPPHFPYLPTSLFRGMFNDGWAPPLKGRHPLATGSRMNYRNKRQAYDEFIANLDAEFGRLLDHLEVSGRLDDSYLFVTSDHGELFERGVRGHSTPLLFEPVIRIPLLVSVPGQRERVDVHAPTSSVDLMPTVLDIAGIPIPAQCQGQVLPALGGTADPQRETWVMEAKMNATHGPLQRATLALLQGTHKLVYYYGYSGYARNFEFYDLQDDPEERQDQYPHHPQAAQMQSRLLDQFEAARRSPYSQPEAL